MSIFEKNLQTLKKINPNLSNKIKNIETNKRFEVFVANNINDANILDTSTNLPIYLENPTNEIEKIVENLRKYALYKAHYFFGIGNGYLFKKLLENKNIETIYIFEPEVELMYIVLNLVDFSYEIENRKIVLIETENFNQGVFNQIINPHHKLYFKAYKLHIHSDFYEKNYTEQIIHVNKVVTQTFSYFVNSSGNDTTDELLGLEHFLQNLPLMIKNPTLRELEKKAKNSNIAIIVATGPSLAKQLPLLKKIQKYVTIISVDASLPILENEAIKPDIVTSIERIPLTGKFYEKTSKEFQKDIVFALTSVVDQKLLNNIKAGQLQLNMRPTGSHYYFMELDKWGYVGLGMSAANLAYEIASNIGYEKIVLIGQDLAYGKDGSSHSKDHIFGEDEVKQNDNKDDYIEAYGGDGKVKTTWAWKLFLGGYEQIIAKNNKEGKITTINATEGGARIHGSIEMPFSKVIDKYVDTQTKKHKINLSAPLYEEYMNYIKQSVDKLEKATSLGKNMHFKTKKLLKELTQFINQYSKYKKEELPRYLTEKKSKKIIDKISKIRNQYYYSEFNSFYNILIYPLISHMEYEIAYWSIQTDNSKSDRILKNWKMIVLHHEWCYRVMVNIEAILKIIDEKLPALEECLEEELEMA